MGLVTDAPYHDLCYRIIGAAMDVHNRLGPGHRERAYQRALAIRLEELGFQTETEVPVRIFFDDRPVGLLYLDCLVEGEVIVELKALPHLLTNEEVAQVITYLAATGKPVGLLFNFGRRRLQFKRIFPPRKLEGWRDRIERYIWRPRGTRRWRENIR
ncbi:MAG TPA: GxxExxY protein [Chloroflexi bacterium]|nr:GxxExxY protein [Chloroflexota bacterium]